MMSTLLPQDIRQLRAELAPKLAAYPTYAYTVDNILRQLLEDDDLWGDEQGVPKHVAQKIDLLRPFFDAVLEARDSNLGAEVDSLVLAWQEFLGRSFR